MYVKTYKRMCGIIYLIYKKEALSRLGSEIILCNFTKGSEIQERTLTRLKRK